MAVKTFVDHAAMLRPDSGRGHSATVFSSTGSRWGSGMQWIDRKRMLAAFALAATLGACPNDIGLNDLDPSRKLMNMTRPGWLTFSGHVDDLTLPPVTERDLINQAGQCAAQATT